MDHTEVMNENGYEEEKICIIRDIYERRPPDCEACRLRDICDRNLTEEQLDLVLDQINRNIYRREYWEDNEAELYE